MQPSRATTLDVPHRLLRSLLHIRCGIVQRCGSLTSNKEETLLTSICLELLETGAPYSGLTGADFDFAKMQARIEIPQGVATAGSINAHILKAMHGFSRLTFSRSHERRGDACGEVRIEIGCSLRQRPGMMRRSPALRQFRLRKQDPRQQRHRLSAEGGRVLFVKFLCGCPQ